jgi:hypothetical protein
VELFRKKDSRLYWYDFKVRGIRADDRIGQSAARSRTQKTTIPQVVEKTIKTEEIALPVHQRPIDRLSLNQSKYRGLMPR